MGFLKEGVLVLICIAIHVGGGLLDDSDSTSALPVKTEDISDPFRNSDIRYQPEKRDASSKGHSFMYFGKRSPGQKKVADFLQYLQRNQEPSWKRGHSIMRFGKRGGEKHNFIRFGKRSTSEDYDLNDLTYPDEEKRAAHSMMYFGKRDSPGGQKNGHSMMYFGKRQIYGDDTDDKRAAHSMMYFGKRDIDSYIEPDDLEKIAAQSMMYSGQREADEDFEKRAGHSMMYFGKRNGEDFDKKNGHSMMYFGKRDDDDSGKRTGHSMMYFGKRDSSAENDTEKRAGHSMMYFGKRDDDGELDKRAGHSMMYFGKRMLYDDTLDDEEKRAGHSMMYFGKRNPYENNEPFYDTDVIGKPDDEKRAKHGMMYFGKKNEGPELGGKRAHSMIHFGKRENDIDNDDIEKKASHSIIRFGKRQFYRVGQDPSNWLPASGPLGPVNSRYINLFGPERRQVYDKKKHNMMHFGKRSINEELDALSANDETQQIDRANASTFKGEANKDALITRNKRQANEPEDVPLLPAASYASQYKSSLEDANENGSLSVQDEDQLPKNLIHSKNIFLRFG